jgi:energy-coupling factor transporter ATP-binding protein EcfA2
MSETQHGVKCSELDRRSPHSLRQVGGIQMDQRHLHRLAVGRQTRLKLVIIIIQTPRSPGAYVWR